MMHRSILALVALVAFTIGSGSAYACSAHSQTAGVPQQSVASVDGGSTPILVPTKDGS